MTLANQLSLLRVVLVPVFIFACYLESPVSARLALGIFLLATFTDWLDGFIARRFNQQTEFGAFLDPVADKLMVVAALIMVIVARPINPIVISSLIIILREVYVSALREWMAGQGLRNVVAVGAIGKWKTATQMVALIAILFALSEDRPAVMTLGVWCLMVAAFLALLSMLQYTRAAMTAPAP